MAEIKTKFTVDDAMIKVSGVLWNTIEPLLLSYGYSPAELQELGIKDSLSGFVEDYEQDKSESFLNSYNSSSIHDDLDVLGLTTTKKLTIRDSIRKTLSQYFDEKTKYELINPDTEESEQDYAKYLSYTDQCSENQHKLINAGQTATNILPTTESAKSQQSKETAELIEQYGPGHTTVGQQAVEQSQQQQNQNNNFGNQSGVTVANSKLLNSNNPAATYVSIKLPIFSELKKNSGWNETLVSTADNEVIWKPDTYLELGNVGDAGPKYFKSMTISRQDIVQKNFELLTSKEAISFQNTLPRTYSDQVTNIFNGTLTLSTYFDKSLEMTLLESWRALQTGISVDMVCQPDNKQEIIKRYAMQIEYGYQDPQYATKRCKNLYAMITNIQFNTDLETVTLTFTSMNTYFTQGTMPAELLNNINAYITTFVGTGIGTGARFSHIVRIIAEHYKWNTDQIVETSVVNAIKRPKENDTAISYITSSLIEGAMADDGHGTDYTTGFIEDPSKEMGLSFIYKPTQNLEKNEIQPMKNFNFVINGTNNGTVRSWTPQINNPMGGFKFFWEDALQYIKDQNTIKFESSKGTNIEKITEDIKNGGNKFRDTKDYKTKFYYGIASQSKELFKTNVGITAEAQNGINTKPNVSVVGGTQVPNIVTNTATGEDIKETWLRGWGPTFNEYTYTLDDGINITGSLVVSGDTELRMFDYINIQPMYPGTMTDAPAMHPTAGTFLILGIEDHIDSDFTTTLKVWKSYVRMDFNGVLYNRYGGEVTGMTGTQQVNTLATTGISISGSSNETETSNVNSKFKAGDKIILRQLWLNNSSSATEGISHLYTNDGIVKLKEEIQNNLAKQERVECLNKMGNEYIAKSKLNKEIDTINEKINEIGVSNAFGYQFQLKREKK